MKLLIAFDDTDNLESPGTGHLASQFAEQIEDRGWGTSSFVTRHQLLVHPDIPYTSHNSAMCFVATLNDCLPTTLIAEAGSFLKQASAPGSDPGLCVAQLDRLEDSAELLEFGRAAKQQVLTKDAAYQLAERLEIHLSEHGGTGQGVVGALAGVGLRLGGNDGRLKGRLQLGEVGELHSVAALRAHPLVEEVRGLDGERPGDDELVELGEKIKTVMQEGRSVLLLEAQTGGAAAWRTCNRKALRSF